MRWAVSWILYWFGDLVGRCNDNEYLFTETGFNVYQWLMLTSSEVQGDGEGPWDVNADFK
jgi:hypothetical protein